VQKVIDKMDEIKSPCIQVGSNTILFILIKELYGDSVSGAGVSDKRGHSATRFFKTLRFCDLGAARAPVVS
jgi:hypothetical protein